LRRRDIGRAGRSVVEIEAARNEDGVEKTRIAHAVVLIDVTKILIDSGESGVVREETIRRRAPDLA